MSFHKQRKDSFFPLSTEENASRKHFICCTCSCTCRINEASPCMKQNTQPLCEPALSRLRPQISFCLCHHCSHHKLLSLRYITDIWMGWPGLLTPCCDSYCATVTSVRLNHELVHSFPSRGKFPWRSAETSCIVPGLTWSTAARCSSSSANLYVHITCRSGL